MKVSPRYFSLDGKMCSWWLTSAINSQARKYSVLTYGYSVPVRSDTWQVQCLAHYSFPCGCSTGVETVWSCQHVPCYQGEGGDNQQTWFSWPPVKIREGIPMGCGREEAGWGGRDEGYGSFPLLWNPKCLSYDRAEDRKLTEWKFIVACFSVFTWVSVWEGLITF